MGRRWALAVICAYVLTVYPLIRSGAADEPWPPNGRLGPGTVRAVTRVQEETGARSSVLVEGYPVLSDRPATLGWPESNVAKISAAEAQRYHVLQRTDLEALIEQRRPRRWWLRRRMDYLRPAGAGRISGGAPDRCGRGVPAAQRLMKRVAMVIGQLRSAAPKGSCGSWCAASSASLEPVVYALRSRWGAATTIRSRGRTDWNASRVVGPRARRLAAACRRDGGAGALVAFIANGYAGSRACSGAGAAGDLGTQLQIAGPAVTR
jgi:hypothetical protein